MLLVQVLLLQANNLPTEIILLAFPIPKAEFNVPGNKIIQTQVTINKQSNLHKHSPPTFREFYFH